MKNKALFLISALLCSIFCVSAFAAESKPVRVIPKINKPAAPYKFVDAWGAAGSEDGQFKFPQGIAIDTAGNVYVADSLNYRIQKFDRDGNFIAKWPIGAAFCIAYASGTIYVSETKRTADNLNSYALCSRYDTNGDPLPELPLAGTTGPPPPEGEGQIQVGGPIAVDILGNVYMAFPIAVYKFNPDGSPAGQVQTPNAKAGQVCYLNAIAVDASGNIYVAEIGESIRCINKLNPAGDFITKWGSLGSGVGQFGGLITGIAVDASGNVYVADNGNKRIQKFTADGAFICQFGNDGTGNMLLNAPWAIAVDASGNVYVIDWNSVKKYKPTAANLKS
jgi:sugar lactone lactonase YvrE